MELARGSDAISIWSTPPDFLSGQCFYDFPSPQRVFEHEYSIDGLEDFTPEKCIEICRSAQGTDPILNLLVSRSKGLQNL